MSPKIKVCLVLEGSYPYITGGVSSWVQQLILGLPQIDFVLYTISPKQNQKIQYNLPPNIIEHKDIVISAKQKSLKKPKSMTRLLKEIKIFHDQFDINSIPDIKNMLKLLLTIIFSTMML